jgi:hypothetical protein
MNAMQSLLDKKMLYLDLVSGAGGAVLYEVMRRGVGQFQWKAVHWFAVVAVLLARVIADYGYSTLVSATRRFGGTNLEFGLSSAVWFALILGFTRHNGKQALMLYGATLLVMMATARLTRWG